MPCTGELEPSIARRMGCETLPTPSVGGEDREVESPRRGFVARIDRIIMRDADNDGTSLREA